MIISIATLLRKNAPSYHLRFKSVFELLRVAGKIDYREIIKVLFGKYTRVSFDRNPDLFFIARIKDAVFLRKIFDNAVSLRVPIIFETDDLILHDRKKDELIKNFYEISEYLKKASGIVTSTTCLADELKRYNSRVFVFPNLLDPNIWNTNKDDYHSYNKQIKICCIGTGIIPENFKFIIPAIEYCLKGYGRDVIFYIWGNDKYVDKNVRRLKNVKIIKKLPYAKYAQVLQKSRFDMAVVPLIDSNFNRAKSNIKYLEYSICKIPTLFSKVKPYEGLPDGKSCILVENDPDSWCNNIVNMIEDKELRHRLSNKAFKDVVNNYILNEMWADTYLSKLVNFCGN